MTAVVLDLGCGTAKTAGAIGLDVVPLAGVDLIGDLSERPYPFASDTFDAIYLNDVIEHLPNTIKTMEELYRILKPEGRVFIRVVNWNSRCAAMDPTHVGYYTEHTFDFFGKRVGRSYYTRARFDVVQVRRVYNRFAELLCPNERLLHFFSQFWSNVLDDLHFELRAVKPAAQGDSRPIAGAPHNWFRHLRCPIALSQGGRGVLTLVGDWLHCEETGCKYPLRNGVPCLSREYGLRWRDVPLVDLPSPAPFPELMPVEDRPILSISQDDGFRAISSVEDLYQELRKTYGRLPTRALKYAILDPVMRHTTAGREKLNEAVLKLRRIAGRLRRKVMGVRSAEPSQPPTTQKKAA
ncbi:MAG: class I SAM-dependent methyltransferase [Pirellulales bacterium]